MSEAFAAHNPPPHSSFRCAGGVYNIRRLSISSPPSDTEIAPSSTERH